MSSKVRLLLLVLCLSVVAILAGRRIGLFLSSAGNYKSASESLQQSEIWYEGSSGYAQAMELERDSHAPLIIYFRTDWCPYCRKMDSDILPAAEVAAFLKTVIKVRVNPERGSNERALADSFGVHGYPSVFIVPADTHAQIKIYPFVRDGETFQALPPAEFVESCRRAAAGNKI